MRRLPLYVICDKIFRGTYGDTVIGKVYITSGKADFSTNSWEDIWKYGSYFKEATEEEWRKQEGISNSIEYQIF